MDIKNIAITATMVIQSLVKLLENEDVDISSVKFKVGSESEGYESPEFELEKLINLAYEGLEKIKEQTTPEGFVLMPIKPTETMVMAVVDEHEGDAFLPYSIYDAYVKQAMIEAQEQSYD